MLDSLMISFCTFLTWFSIKFCSWRMLSSFLWNSFRTSTSIFSQRALNSCLSLFCFSWFMRSRRSKFLLISSCALTLYSCSAISLFTVSDILFSSLFWKSPCMFRSRFCMFSVIRSLCTSSWFTISLSLTRSWPRVRRLFSAVCNRSMNLSPNSLSKSFPLVVRWAINARFLSEFASLCYNSCSRPQQFLPTLPIPFSIFSTLSASLTTSMKSTVIFYFSLASLTKAESAQAFCSLRAFRVEISWLWYSICLRRSFTIYLKLTISALTMLALSTLGISLITRFYSPFSRSDRFDYKFRCRSSQNLTICSNLTLRDSTCASSPELP